jgi:hypothetical protein
MNKKSHSAKRLPVRTIPAQRRKQPQPRPAIARTPFTLKANVAVRRV